MSSFKAYCYFALVIIITFIVELFEFPQVKDLKAGMGSITHFALGVGNPKEVYERLRGQGVESILIDKGKGKYTYFIKDPDGILIELKE